MLLSTALVAGGGLGGVEEDGILLVGGPCYLSYL